MTLVNACAGTTLHQTTLLTIHHETIIHHRIPRLAISFIRQTEIEML